MSRLGEADGSACVGFIMMAGGVGMGGGWFSGEMGGKGAGWPGVGVLGRLEAAPWVSGDVGVGVAAGAGVSAVESNTLTT